MKLDIKQSGDTKRDLHIIIDKDSLKSFKSKVLDKINNQVNVPGFRKGKAPLDLIEKRYTSLVKEELLKEAIPFYYQKAIEEYKLEVVSMPKIKDTRYTQESLSFIAEVEIKPAIKIDPKFYNPMKLKYAEVRVEDKEINEFIDKFKEKTAQILSKKKEDIDDSFASNWAGYKDKEEFKKAVEAELYINKVIQRRRDLEQQISQNLLNKVKCGLPEAVVGEQKKHLMTQQIIELRSRGVHEEDLKKHTDQLSQKAEALAKEQVKLYYILEEIAKIEKLAFDKKDLYELVLGFILSNSLAK
jgi:FKBP-type peptidyl-prolyl cis-trans isomerase (trigger factor)